MGSLVYAAIASLDGFTKDRDGSFEWVAPDAEVHGFVNDLERGIGTYLYGRRMYETMVYWETFEADEDEPEVVRDYARIWRAADKVVYSTSLASASSGRTRIERTFDPDVVRDLVASAPTDVSIGGSDLAGQALAAGLVDELHLFVVPVIVGGGTAALPGDVRCALDLRATDRFASGVVHLHYRIGR
jgi:dihydrofolate reductase